MSTVRLDKHKVNLDKFYCEHSTYCEEDIRIENQEHLEQCEGFSYEQRGLDLTEEMGKNKIKKLYLLSHTQRLAPLLATSVYLLSHTHRLTPYSRSFQFLISTKY